MAVHRGSERLPEPSAELISLIEADGEAWALAIDEENREHEDAHDDDPFHAALAAPTVGLTALEKLLLAIIKAHPSPEPDVIRLRCALAALLGDDAPAKGSPGRGTSNDDELLLHWIAAQRLRSAVRSYGGAHDLLANSPTSELLGEQKADEAADDFASVARRALQLMGPKKASATEKAAIQRLKSAYDKREPQLLNQVRYAAHEPHLIEHDRLEKAAHHLQEIGIKLNLPSRPQMFAWR